MPVPALPPYLIEPIWQQFSALLPEREINHPLGCHRSRIPDRVVFAKLVQVLVFGCAYEKIADATCSATSLRDRRDEWIALGAMDTLRELALEAYDRFVGLELADVAVDCCITKAPVAARRQAVARSTGESRAPNAPRRWTHKASPGHRHRSAKPPRLAALLTETLDVVAQTLGELPESTSIHLDRGYASETTRQRLGERALSAESSRKGEPAPR